MKTYRVNPAQTQCSQNLKEKLNESGMLSFSFFLIIQIKKMECHNLKVTLGKLLVMTPSREHAPTGMASFNC